MRLGDFLADLGRPVAYYPAISRLCGGTHAGLVLCQLAYWYGKQRDPDGWTRKTWAQLEVETGLSLQEQRTGRIALKRLGLLEERLRGVPATVEYRINFDALETLFQMHSSLLLPTNWIVASNKLDCCQQQTISETTSETTAESSCARSALPKSPEKKQQDPTALKQAATETSKPEAMLIEEINRIAGTRFRAVKSALQFARARLYEYSYEELVVMLRWRWRTWDAEQRRQWFRPETLLNATKCGSYMGQCDAAPPRPGPARNLELDRIAARDRELGRA